MESQEMSFMLNSSEIPALTHNADDNILICTENA